MTYRRQQLCMAGMVLDVKFQLSCTYTRYETHEDIIFSLQPSMYWLVFPFRSLFVTPVKIGHTQYRFTHLLMSTTTT